MKKNLLKMYSKTTDCIRAVLSDKRCCMFLCFALVSVVVLANANNMNAGVGAMAEVESAVKAYVKPTQTLMYAVAGVIAVVGAGQVYFKMQNGDQDVTKSIMMLIGACLFLCAAAYALPKFFGL